MSEEQAYRPVSDKDYSSIKLWFFRELSDEQRLSMFRLMGWPVDDMTTQSMQLFALRSVLGRTPPVKAAPEVTRSHYG